MLKLVLSKFSDYNFFLGKLLKIIASFKTRMKAERIVLSVGAGRSGTEMQGSDLCVCFDTDKRSLFASAFAYKYRHSEKNNVIFHHFDMTDGLYRIMKMIRIWTSIPIVVLFQHPSPSSDAGSRLSLASAGADCIRALHADIVDSVHFVYDYHTTKNCWNEVDLKSMVLSMVDPAVLSLTSIGDATCICESSDNKYTHPVFGTVFRTGWAQMKRAKEMAFKIGYF